jgi:hypothetical protein
MIDGLDSRPIPERRPWSVWDSFYQAPTIDKVNAASDATLAPADRGGDLGGFRYLPKSDVALVGTIQSHDGEATVHVDVHDITVNSSTGAITRVAFRDSATKRTVREIFHGAFRTYNGDILFPSLTVLAAYDARGSLGSIKVTLIEDAKFNLDNHAALAERSKYPSDKPTPPGTMMRKLVVRNPVRDPSVATFRSPDVNPSPKRTTSFNLLLVTAAVLSVIVYMLLRVVRSGPPS